ncbi:MAG: glycosyltransferase family 39 protein [Verrucomicrobiota bacterium]|nr:glycosyltransferase family 39 protein [Verrucomicrobiota bacterium]
MSAPGVSAPSSFLNPAQAARGRTSVKVWIIAGLILALGMFLRIHSWKGFHRAGFDEVLYRSYVDTLSDRGYSAMPELARAYIAEQTKRDGAILPPTRFLYIAAATTWRNAFHSDTPPVANLREPGATQRDPALVSLQRVSGLATILTLLVTAAFARRLAGDRAMLGVLALMACAPTQIHMSQHGLIDGFFSFWALTAVWLCWENLQQPDDRRWQLGYAAVLAAMVLTKENAAFVYIALSGLLGLAKWQHWGRVSRGLVLSHLGGAMLGGAMLVLLGGGLQPTLEIYLLLIAKAQAMDYAIRTGDGPWFRYLVDLLLASPIVLLLAVAAAFQLRRNQHALLYVLAFIALSYLVMCNVKYGMNLRYANMWDMPLRLLAFTQLGWLAERYTGKTTLILTLSTLFLCALELHQYQLLFVSYPGYELVSANLLEALKILKF